MRILTGIQPSGTPHLGNYFGYFKQNIDLLGEEENLLMIADLHALTTVHNAQELRTFRQELSKDFLACGFDPSRGTLFFQSYVPEHTELSWILSCSTPMGLLERAVSYKDKVQQGLEANVGLFTYPVLQAADILIYDADVVPVGKDQKQHIEIARDIAQKFNHRYGSDLLSAPEPRIVENVAVIPGTDGQKMSKSYGNTIPMFGEEKVIKKAIMGIVTDSTTMEEPKNPENCVVYALHSLLLDESEKNALADRYRAGGLGYGDAKKLFFEAFMDYFGPLRERRSNLKEKDVQDVILQGSARARAIAGATIERVRTAVGLR
ncbi:tryptophan--tRNA ligase [Candidatus Peregrinibacteria bacterium CG10_big_fil_rev_8_21_14_0_10_49_24]|nr:MAG: tryptophan--tRNA ligase [Candidatus Peregrinibacteria bacterium CG11_big_fil_rev_8_21_14_0_20_49_14]PIR51214.1 MAG: tryptophan--tRNA ligase [Candidatus Peregrinibacteria bacterium CG10_big_fil_rev_8_21_14_0_10_49_24]PJA67252.1 MAG: tryptophan--tRNA ligase [Candidatus Peregrinibacteria bacterium CG_4_9_14_3_um_filter_49_12]